MANVFAGLLAEIATLEPMRQIGRVCEVGRGILQVSGLAQAASLGDRVQLTAQDMEMLSGSGAVRDLQIILGAGLQKALKAC